MIFLDIILVSLKSLTNNRLRTFLSMLGIIIGVAAVIAVIAISSGAEEQMLDRLNNLGTNLITITPGTSRGGGGTISQDVGDVFTYETAEQILSLCPSIEKVDPYISSRVLAIYGNTNLQVSTRASSTTVFEISDLELEMGRFFTDMDLEDSKMIAVIGSTVAEDLFGSTNPIGQKVKVGSGNNKFSLTVVGVLAEKGQVMFTNYDNTIFLPITTWMNRFQRTDFVNGFTAQARSREEADDAVAQVEYLLYQKFKDLDKFKVSSQAAMLSMATDMTNTFKILLAGIASISLLVGGIGIMNITLVSVTERTREIGIRKALGAKRRVILLQFLIEASIVSIVGGLFGIAFGLLGSMAISKVGGWPFVISSSAILISIGFSTLIGIFFGIYPANKAAGLDPVDALSYE
ncbi:MAG: ABC transporter permease [Halanaerobiales bacterium]|nr:ABC transporter permease [Halanaerobiales bacterium]